VSNPSQPANPILIDNFTDNLIDNVQPIKTTCPYCGVGCGIEVSSHQGKVIINGDKAHPANFGKLCIKGKNLGDTLENHNRLDLPQINQQPQSWPRALDYVASKLNQTISEHGKDSVAFYGSGQLLTEDYYVANKLMKGFVGSGNIDTNSRLCMSSAVAAHKRAFGEDIVPMSYSDITKADLIVLAGSNLAWCHPVIYQRIREEKQRRPELKLVVIDPRVTASKELADLHLPIKPGGDLILFNSLLHYLNQQDLLDPSFDDFDEVLSSAASDQRRINDIGLTSAQIEQFFQWFGDTKRVVTLFSQGINQSVQGTDQVSAIINCHLASGKIGKIGSGPFSITGQPNAMGGREVGALANTLAGHIEFEDAELHQALSEFWQTDNLATKPGFKAIELFDAINAGKIKAIWIMATNPLVSLPNQKMVRQALEKCPLVIVSDCVANNDTLALADVILPAQSWGEKSGTVTNSERRISRQRNFLVPYGEAKPDWWIISQVAKRMGFANGFNYHSARDVFVEHAKLSGLNNQGSRAFDISAFGQLTPTEYHNFTPRQWPQPLGEPTVVSDQLLFSDQQYFTPNRKARLINVKVDSFNVVLLKADSSLFTLNTGRNRDQWHTQTRTGKSAILTNHHPEPIVDIHGDDAAVLNIVDNQLVSLQNEHGKLVIRAKVSTLQRRGDLFMPIHWSHSNSNQGGVGQLVKPMYDPISGQPAFKHSKVNIKPLSSGSEAMIVVKQPLPLDLAHYQIEQRISGGYCYHLASEEQPKALYQRLNDVVLSDNSGQFDTFNASGPLEQYLRQSYFVGGKPVAGVVVGKLKSELPTGWIVQFYGDKDQTVLNREFISADTTKLQQCKTFCQCLNIPVADINRAIDEGQLTIADIRTVTGAGSGCGSCIGDISLALNSLN